LSAWKEVVLMAVRPQVCPRCGAGSVFHEDDGETVGWYCLICGWREATPAAVTLGRGRSPVHAGWRL
jgi:ribosomal protein S27AE